jgi:hypothetical protein
MFTSRSFIAGKVILGSVILASSLAIADPSYNDNGSPVVLRQQKLNGPRMGVTWVPTVDWLDQDGSFAKRLDERGIGNVISQFGWHFEWIVAPDKGGPCFVTQIVPFIGGVEYGRIIPSISTVLGIRMPMGFEFGMGPNVLTTFDPDAPLSTSLLIAIGQSLRFGAVSIPLNIALLTNKTGNRVSFLFGYAIPERQSRARFD